MKFNFKQMRAKSIIKKSLIQALCLSIVNISGFIREANAESPDSLPVFKLKAAKAQEVKRSQAIKKLDLGNFNLYHGNTKQAVIAYKNALAVYPDLFEAHYGLANCYVLQKKYDSAIGEYLEVLSLKPKHKESLVTLGNLYKAEGRVGDALKYFEQAESAGLNTSMFYTAWGLALAQSNNLEQAKLKLAKAEKMNKSKAPSEIFLGKGVIDYKEGNLEKALEDLDTAIKKKVGNNPQARNFKAEILYAMGKVEEAKKEFIIEIEKEDAVPAAFQVLGNIYLQEGKLEQAQKAFELGCKWYPKNPDIILGKAVCLEKQGKLVEAVDAYMNAVSCSANKDQMQKWINHVMDLKIAVHNAVTTTHPEPGKVR